MTNDQHHAAEVRSGWSPVSTTVGCDWCGECDWCDNLHRPPHDAEMAAARDADRVARVAEGGGL